MLCFTCLAKIKGNMEIFFLYIFQDILLFFMYLLILLKHQHISLFGKPIKNWIQFLD